MERTVDNDLLEQARATGFSQPPPRKVDCPIVDIHTHTWSLEAARPLFEAARLYGIDKLGMITTMAEGAKLARKFPEASIITWLDWEHVDDPDKFASVNRKI